MEWDGFEFKKDALVFLDVYGTNHDPRVWTKPKEFLPERFEHWNGDPFNFIPQGGGNYHSGHRCAGERITIEAMKVSVEHLVNFMDYDTRPQNLNFSMTRLPTYPESGFIIQNVRSKESLSVNAE
jgi:fatty-acid peroxygenase